MKQFWKDENASPVVEVMLLIPLLLILAMVITNIVFSSMAKAQVDAELRDATRLVAAYGGDCGKYRTDKMLQGGGSCSAGGLYGKGQSVTEFYRAKRFTPSLQKAFHIKVEAFGCHLGGKALFKGDGKQAVDVSDPVSCSMRWHYNPVGPKLWFSYPKMSIQRGYAEVGKI